MHNGENGTLLFPLSWLSFDVTEFAGTQLRVVAPELQYILKEHPELLNLDWVLREKDILEKECLQDILIRKGINICSLNELVTSI